MSGFKRDFSIDKSVFLNPECQWIGITFKPDGPPHGYGLDGGMIRVHATIQNRQGIDLSINNTMGDKVENNTILRAEAFHAAYGQAIVDMKRIKEAFDLGMRDVDDIMNHVQDQYIIDQTSR